MTRVLIIGCGSIGRRHAANAARLATVAVVDELPERSSETARSMGLQTYNSVDEGLASRPDVVIVAAPHQTHVPLASKALAVGADVLIEKPLSTSLDGVPALLSQADQHGRKIHVVCNMRFHRGVAALRRSLPRIGRTLFARAQFGQYLPDWRPNVDYRTSYSARADMGGGIVLDAIHEIDYLVWFFGPVDRVTAETGRLSDLAIDVEDYAMLALTHRNGVRSEIHLDCLQRSKRRGCEIVGTDGTLVWTSEGSAPEECLVRFFPPGNNQPETILYDPNLDPATPYIDLLQLYLSNRQTDNSLLEGRGAADDLAIALAALLSAAVGYAVKPRVFS